jgi:hypothetical protein
MWTKDSMKAAIPTASEKWLAAAVIALWHRQTEDEKSTDSTNHHNNKGFTGADAKRLSLIAKCALANKHLDKPFSQSTGKKSGKSNAWMVGQLQKRLIKYSGQLAMIANQKAQSKEAA